MFTIRKKRNQKQEKPEDYCETTQDFATVKLAIIQALELGSSEPFLLSQKSLVYLDRIATILLKDKFNLPIGTTSKTLLESVDIDGNPTWPRIDVFRFVKTEDGHFVIRSFYKNHLEEYKQRFDVALEHIHEWYNGTPNHVLDELKAEISKLEASLPKSKTLGAYMKKDRQICIFDLIYQTLTNSCECTAICKAYPSWSDKEEKVIDDAKEKYGHLVNLEVEKLDENTCKVVCTTK
jgi:hypothetical protein